MSCKSQHKATTCATNFWIHRKIISCSRLTRSRKCGVHWYLSNPLCMCVLKWNSTRLSTMARHPALTLAGWSYSEIELINVETDKCSGNHSDYYPAPLPLAIRSLDESRRRNVLALPPPKYNVSARQLRKKLRKNDLLLRVVSFYRSLNSARFYVVS